MIDVADIISRGSYAVSVCMVPKAVLFAHGTTRKQGSYPGSTPRLPASGLPLSRTSTSIVPHQFRHTYATEMLRSGVSFPVLMKLLSHVDPAMTMRYVDGALTDLEREFQLARSKPRHLAPQPKTSVTPDGQASTA